MTKPITDKAEIALEYPDKLYVGLAHPVPDDAGSISREVELTG